MRIRFLAEPFLVCSSLGGRFGESNTKVDGCYAEWKTSPAAAKLKAFLEEELKD